MNERNNSKKNELTELEAAYLLALYDSVYGSLSASVPIEAICKKIKDGNKKKAKKILKKLRAKGYIRSIQRGRNDVWMLQPKGRIFWKNPITNK